MTDLLSLREKQVLFELMKNSRVNDKELAKKLSTSQPTIARIRNKLYTNGFIETFTIFPHLSKLGLSLIVFTFLSSFDFSIRKKLWEWVSANPNVIFASEGEGLREDTLLIASIHSTFDDFQAFSTSLRKEFSPKIEGISSFFAPTKNSLKDFSLVSAVEKKLFSKKQPEAKKFPEAKKTFFE